MLEPNIEEKAYFNCGQINLANSVKLTLIKGKIILILSFIHIQ